MNKFFQIGDFILDVVLNESHKMASDVTEYPIEGGGTLSDNIRPKPLEISVEGIVTNHPLPSNLIAQQQVAKPLFSQPDTVSGGSTTPAVIKHLRSDEAYEYLRKLWLSRDVFTIRTSLGVYTNMTVQSIDTTRDSGTGDALRFTAQFKQLEILTNERTTRKPGYGGKRRRGPQGTDPNVGAKVQWRRGVQPGGPVIYDAKYVEMRADPKDAKVVKWWYIKNQPTNVTGISGAYTIAFTAAGNLARAQRNTEVAGFFSKYGKEENRLLSERELYWLGKDLERDRNAARVAAFEDDIVDAFVDGPQDATVMAEKRRAAAKARSFGAMGTPGNPYDPDVLRRPIQDPSKMQRSVMQKQGNGADPLGNISSKKPLNTDALSNSNSNLSNGLGRTILP